MKPPIHTHLTSVLEHLYINPLEKCNLHCQMCYTKKTDPILSQRQILAFIKRYQKAQKLVSITFCGGEVFALDYFPKLINQLTRQGTFIQVITNGTLDRLDEFKNPNLINLIISLDGLPTYHDQNRGEGNFAKSLSFLKRAKLKGFHTDIFSIVTRQNFKTIDAFEAYLKKELGVVPTITYHPRKPPTYLQAHPVSNVTGTVKGFDFLEPKEMRQIMRTRQCFPPKILGCYQIALASDGKVYGCCEGIVPLGVMTDAISVLIERLSSRLNNPICLGCSQPDFICGIKDLLPL